MPFRYQGQYEDTETGLYYNRFRYYSTDTGLYLSQDPIGLEGGNPTLYGYVSDTNSWVDTLGLNEINDIGQRGETNSGITKNTTRIPSASGKKQYRIPDAMSEDGRHLTEVKNVKYQYLSSQLKDDIAYANREGKKGTVTLIVDTNKIKNPKTGLDNLSKDLQEEIDKGNIILEKKDLNSCNKK